MFEHGSWLRWSCINSDIVSYIWQKVWFWDWAIFFYLRCSIFEITRMCHGCKFMIFEKWNNKAVINLSMAHIFWLLYVAVVIADDSTSIHASAIATFSGGCNCRVYMFIDDIAIAGFLSVSQLASVSVRPICYDSGYWCCCQCYLWSVIGCLLLLPVLLWLPTADYVCQCSLYLLIAASVCVVVTCGSRLIHFF